MMKELAGFILSTDDSYFSSQNIQILIVGVPGSLKDAFGKICTLSPAQLEPIANRITELPEVSRMNIHEVSELVHREFIDELNLVFLDVSEKRVVEDISWNTDCIAQHVQDLCLQIALEACDSNNRIINKSVMARAEKRWANQTLSGDLRVIEGNMNSPSTKGQIKNQVMYILGQMPEKFSAYQVENLFRSQFPGHKNIQVSRFLREFSISANPMLKKEDHVNYWRFKSPKYRMTIRNYLYRESDGRILFKNIL
jgi:hypothetical protein